MAVSAKVRKSTSIPVDNPIVIDGTTVDHVKRILGDHDYVKSVQSDDKKDGKIPCSEDKIVGITCRLNGQEFSMKSVASDKSDMKDKGEEKVPNDGIQASNLSSLLEQFLEYEEAATKTSLLTPAASPGHCENWNEQVLVEENTHPNSTELTPPGTPPEESKVFPMDHMTSSSNEKEDEKIHEKDDNTTLEGKRKIKESETNNNETNDTKHVKLSSPSHELGEIANKDKCVENQENVLKEQQLKTTEHCEQQHEQTKVLNNDVLKENIESGSSKTAVETEQCVNKTKPCSSLCETSAKVKKRQSRKDCEQMRRDKQKRRHRERRSNSRELDENSKDERYNAREFEQSRKRSHSPDMDRQSRRKISRDYNKYDHNGNRDCHSDEKYRRHDDYRSHRREKDRHHQRDYNDYGKDYDYHRDYDDHRRYSDHHRRRDGDSKHHLESVKDIERERKINFRLGRSFIKDSAKEERRVVYVGGLSYGTTRDELWNMSRRFGPVEKVSVHLREGDRDNYGFVTFFEPDDARECIELSAFHTCQMKTKRATVDMEFKMVESEYLHAMMIHHGSLDSIRLFDNLRANIECNEPCLEFCFGGRRQYCGGSYVDFDSKTSHIEELTEAYGNVQEELPEQDDFDTLLRQCQEDLERARSP